jgi:nuclear protein localization family protein 4
VRRDGRPMPVEYLLVDVPTGMPKEPYFTFHVNRPEKAFPVENRTLIGQSQDIRSVANYVNEFSSNQFLELASNFHFLLFLLTNDLLKFPKEEIRELCKHIVERDRPKAAEWAEANPNWGTFKELLKAHHENGEATSASGQMQHSAAAKWSCKHCTFENTADRTDCAICGLPA